MYILKIILKFSRDFLYLLCNDLRLNNMDGTIKLVIFSVGVKHPLYNTPVQARIINSHCGYNGRCILAETVEPVHYPEDPEGLLIFSKGKFVGYETRAAFDKIWNGYVEKVL